MLYKLIPIKNNKYKYMTESEEEKLMGAIVPFILPTQYVLIYQAYRYREKIKYYMGFLYRIIRYNI